MLWRVVQVKLRGESMQAAADAADSSMVSVIGLDSEKVQEICDAVNERVGAGSVQIANFLCPGNYVISGSSEVWTAPCSGGGGRCGWLAGLVRFAWDSATNRVNVLVRLQTRGALVLRVRACGRARCRRWFVFDSGGGL